MRVIIACEFSGVVRDAFTRRGHFAISCDLLPSEKPGPHFIGSIWEFLRQDWGQPFDLMIAFPPCTHVAVSGARWFKNKIGLQREALDFMRDILERPIPRIAMENPIGVFSTYWRKPDQIIQPWMFGHGETKATCLWLKNLPKLIPPNVVKGRKPRVHYASPGPNRWKERSRTLQGIADAMADQWGSLVVEKAAQPRTSWEESGP